MIRSPRFFSESTARRLRSFRGFTLIELLVSMTILAMLVVLFAQALGNISSAWGRAQDKMDNYGKARAALNRLQIDLQNIVVRDDLAIFPDTGGSSDFAFYTLQRGLDGGNDRSLSYVSYASGTGNDSDQLVRKDKAYAYAGDSPQFATAPTPTPSPYPTPAPAIAPTLSGTGLTLLQGQLGFAYGFLHSNGKYSKEYITTINGVDSKAVAVTVGILVMDNKNAAILKDSSKLSQLIGECQLDDPKDESGWSPKAIWDYQFGLTSDAPAVGSKSPINVKTYGVTFLAGVRAFERTFPIPTSSN